MHAFVTLVAAHAVPPGCEPAPAGAEIPPWPIPVRAEPWQPERLQKTFEMLAERVKRWRPTRDDPVWSCDGKLTVVQSFRGLADDYDDRYPPFQVVTTLAPDGTYEVRPIFTAEAQRKLELQKEDLGPALRGNVLGGRWSWSCPAFGGVSRSPFCPWGLLIEGELRDGKRQGTWRWTLHTPDGFGWTLTVPYRDDTAEGIVHLTMGPRSSELVGNVHQGRRTGTWMDRVDPWNEEEDIEPRYWAVYLDGTRLAGPAERPYWNDAYGDDSSDPLR